MVSRRTFLLGGLTTGALATGSGVLLIEQRVVPGKVRLDRALGRCGDLPAAPPAGGAVRSHTFASLHRGVDVTATVVLPAGVGSLKGLPVTVALHGSGGTGVSLVSGLALDHYLTDLVARRATRPYAVVSVDGGPDGYWHRRRSGDDPLGMITEELLPWLREQGARTDRTDRIGLIGWSMGGYGALLLAGMLGPGRVAAVAAVSPALFASYSDARTVNAKAFDDAADFERNDVLRRPDPLTGIPTWVDCGGSDPFAPMAERLRERLRPAGEIGPGCHDGSYWRRRLPAQLTFLGHHLARGL